MSEPTFLHRHQDFGDLIAIVGEARGIDPVLVEKDYWIMHSLYGLKSLGLSFELKGGTSLSKGYGLIHRFSEDIDIRIEPPSEMNIKTGPNHDKSTHVAARGAFYDSLTSTIHIDGIIEVIRDHSFDDKKMRSGGVRLIYPTIGRAIAGLKQGILLEVGFDNVTPNKPCFISSWAYDFAMDKIAIADNRAVDVACYHPGYTFVEKLQAISTKFRKQQETGDLPINFMRHYYDIYCLLESQDVANFVGSPEYFAHKARRFGTADNQNIAENEAFRLSDAATFREYEASYQKTAALYYKEQPEFAAILARIAESITQL
jgi:hypothetical protein